MTASVTRSGRSSTKKSIPSTVDYIVTKTKSSSVKKKKQQQQQQQQHHHHHQLLRANNKKDSDLENRLKKSQQQQEQEHNELVEKMNVSEHPEYVRLMTQLDQSKNERLQKVECWRNLERQSIEDWFAAQKKQAWNEFYYAKMKVRSDLVKDAQEKITRLKQELSQLNKQLKIQVSKEQNEKKYENWIPPERLYTIGSFVVGATEEEIDRDLSCARQPYNGDNTPNLVYSDYESRSTTDTVEEVVDNHHNELVTSNDTTTTAAEDSTEQQHHHHHHHYYQQPVCYYPSLSTPTPTPTSTSTSTSTSTPTSTPTPIPTSISAASSSSSYQYNNNTSHSSSSAIITSDLYSSPYEGRQHKWLSPYHSTTST